MKDAVTIAEDCGLDETRANLLKQIMSEPDNPETYEGVVESIIGALYRRIERLDEEKQIAIAYIKDVYCDYEAQYNDALTEAADSHERFDEACDALRSLGENPPPMEVE